jgi:hypothetical protein
MTSVQEEVVIEEKVDDLPTTYFKKYQPVNTDITIEAKTDEHGHLRLKSYKIGEKKIDSFLDSNNANADVFDEKNLYNVLPKMKVQSDSLVKAQAAAAAAAGAVAVPVPVPVPGSGTETVTVPGTGPENGTGSGTENENAAETLGGAKNIFPLSHSKKSRSYKSKTGKKKVIRRNKSRKYRK